MMPGEMEEISSVKLTSAISVSEKGVLMKMPWPAVKTALLNQTLMYGHMH